MNTLIFGIAKIQSVAALYERRVLSTRFRFAFGGHRPPLQRTLALIIGFLCLGAVTVPAQNTVELQKVTLHLGKTTIDTEVAATPEEGERGLMFRTKLADDAGMIFVLPVGRAHFWMKNTLIPLSIAFIDKNGVILEIHDMMPPDKDHPVPDSELPRTDSDSNQVAYALEANLHWFSLNSIKPGDKLTPAPATLIKTVAP